VVRLLLTTLSFFRMVCFKRIIPVREVDYAPWEYPLVLKATIYYYLGRVIGRRLSLALSRQVLGRHMRTERELGDVIETSFDYVGFGPDNTIRPMQSRQELADLARRVADRNPETVVELGTARGGTFYLWCRYFDSLSTAVSVDLPSESAPGPTAETPFLRHFSDETTVFVRGDAHADETRARIADQTDEIDFLFIDADKSYEGVKRHFEMYGSLVENGIVAFHDIRYNEGVAEFWAEIVERYETETIVTPVERLSGRETFGTGVVYLDGGPDNQ